MGLFPHTLRKNLTQFNKAQLYHFCSSCPRNVVDVLNYQCHLQWCFELPRKVSCFESNLTSPAWFHIPSFYKLTIHCIGKGFSLDDLGKQRKPSHLLGCQRWERTTVCIVTPKGFAGVGRNISIHANAWCYPCGCVIIFNFTYCNWSGGYHFNMFTSYVFVEQRKIFR